MGREEIDPVLTVGDLANLDGVTRALSFIGLGLVLLGIGLAYQKLRQRPAPPGHIEGPAVET